LASPDASLPAQPSARSQTRAFQPGILDLRGLLLNLLLSGALELQLQSKLKCREDPESPVGKRVFVIWPKVCAGNDASGLAKIRVIEEIENLSPELNNRGFSQLVRLITENSIFVNPGPINHVAPEAAKTAGRTTNGAVSNQRFGVRL